jgi:hypothetical protein
MNFLSFVVMCGAWAVGSFQEDWCYFSCIWLVGAAMDALNATRGNLARDYPNPCCLARSMLRRIQVSGGQIDKAGQLQIGESSF